MMFIKIMSLMAMIIVGITINNPVYAYDIPQSACYIHGDDINLGEIYIYIPCVETTKFSMTSDNQPVLVSSSNVTGYLSTTEDYTINFRPYYFGRYREGSYTSDYTDLFFSVIYDDTNVNLFTDSDQYISKYKNTILISSLVFVGVILCLIYMRR